MNRIPFNQICRSIVYILYAEKDGCCKPFYVGESGRGLARLADYVSMQFSAATDFKVGQTIKYLEEDDWNVSVEIIECKDKEQRKALEKSKLEEIGKASLLNSEASYNYRNQQKEDYQEVLRSYVRREFAT